VGELYDLDLIVEAYHKLVPSTREVDNHSKHVDNMDTSPYDWDNRDQLNWED
jgi:hypothetical protein